MKAIALAALVAAALLLGDLRLTAADAVRFKFLASVYTDDKGGGLRLPEGVACDAKGGFLVGDTGNDRLVRFAYQGEKMTGGREIKTPELSAPSRLHLNSKGELFALDAKQRRIVHLGADGGFKDVLSFDGVPPPATIIPKDFALDTADRLYVLDVFSARVLMLDSAGQFQKALSLPAEAAFVSDLAVDTQGSVVVLDSIERKLYVAATDATTFTPVGKDLRSSLATLPTSLTMNRGTVFITEGIGGAVASFGRDGSFLSRQLTPGWKEGSLNHPAQLCINGSDQVFIADRDNSRVQIFALSR